MSEDSPQNVTNTRLRTFAEMIMACCWPIVVGIGVWLIRAHAGDAAAPARSRYIHDPKWEPASDAHEVVRSAIGHDWWVIAGYVLVLGASCVVYGRLAFSDKGRRAAPLLWCALGIAAAADVVENLLVLYALDHGGPRLAIAVAATIKWSAGLVAALALPLAVLCSIRLVKSYLSSWWISRPSRVDQAVGPPRPWWSRVLDGVPSPTQNPSDDQKSWQDAYVVPNVDPRAARGSIALCLSGGGVRSACVAMGAMQTFSNPRTPEITLDEVDYVISVSGGGYSAGARVLAVQPEQPPNGQESVPLSARYAPGSPEFDHLRRNSSYIADSAAKLLRALAEVVKNLVASLIILFALAVLIGWAAGWFYAKVPLAAFIPDKTPMTTDQLPQKDPGLLLPSLAPHQTSTWMTLALLLAIAIVLAALALIVEWLSAIQSFTVWQDRLNAMAKGVVLFTLVTLVVTVILPGLMRLASPAENDKRSAAGAIGGVAAVAVVQLFATLMSMVQKNAQSGEQRWWKKLLPPTVLQLVIATGTLAVLLCTWLVALGITGAWVFNQVTRPGTSVASVGHWRWYWIAIGLVTLYVWCLDVTSLSLHPFYRARLAKAFSVRRINGKAEPYLRREPTWLDQYAQGPNGKPKFIFAAAAAVSDDKKPGPGQHAVSFVLAADYIGGPALGWLKTDELRLAVPQRMKRDLTVQAAVATSGAAFASTMGRQSFGLQTLFAASGARLGTWLPNPAFVRSVQKNEDNKTFPKALPSLRGGGYFYRELLQIKNSEGRLVQVTDGGHYENLGLVEALRRRCRLIYCIDGGGDRPPLLSGLADAIRLAQNELGVEIEFEPLPPVAESATAAAAGSVNGPEPASPSNVSRRRFATDELAPGSAEAYPPAHPLAILNDRLTAGSVIRARIRYPAASGVGRRGAFGVLIFAKATLWKELPDWVLTHAAEKGNEIFPHDSTGNQWFTEGQFSAYIEVGRRIAAEALQVPLLSDVDDPRPGAVSQTRRQPTLTIQ